MLRCNLRINKKYLSRHTYKNIPGRNLCMCEIYPGHHLHRKFKMELNLQRPQPTKL